MTREEMIRRGWRESDAGSDAWYQPGLCAVDLADYAVARFERWKDAAVAAERERCARIADGMFDWRASGHYQNAAQAIAASIREEPKSTREQLSGWQPEAPPAGAVGTSTGALSDADPVAAVVERNVVWRKIGSHPRSGSYLILADDGEVGDGLNLTLIPEWVEADGDDRGVRGHVVSALLRIARAAVEAATTAERALRKRAETDRASIKIAYDKLFKDAVALERRLAAALRRDAGREAT